MAGAVNRLMERLRRTLEAERSFTANSAHELRTPIAAILAQTQRLIADAPDGPLRERAARIENSLHRLARLSEKLMQLAKAESGGVLADQAQDLLPVVGHVIDEFRVEHLGDSRLRLVSSATGALRSRLDPDAFAILLRNLIENAIRHGAPDGPVDISIPGDGTIHVCNEGPVVAPEKLARIKERFERGRTDAQGAGLGLAIADTIAQLAGARLILQSPASGRRDGFEAVLDLGILA